MSKIIFNNGYYKKEDMIRKDNINKIDGNKIECITNDYSGYFGKAYYKEGYVYIYEGTNKIIKKINVNDIDLIKVNI